MRNLSLLLDFDEQYRRDQQQDGGFLHRRDRRLAVERGIDGERGSLAAWLAAVRGPPATRGENDPRLRGWRWLRALFVAAGVALGVMAMLGLLYYAGGRRINVTLIIAVAMLQLLLALLTAAETLIGWQPWRGVLDDALARWWPASSKPSPMLHAVAVPLAARVAQTGGLAFGVAALVVLLSQVVVRDLAFGWSTTLQASAPAYHAMTSALAWPWRGWLPGAVPSLELVEQSRFFRAGSHAVVNPELLGTWWRFIAMLWLFYVVVPRVALLALARAQLGWRVRGLLASHAGRAALRERCATPWVESSDGGDRGAVPDGGPDASAPGPAIAGRVLIRWAGAGTPGVASDWLGGDATSLDAGGSASLAEDAAALARARAIGGPVIVVVRGWEPPTGELGDFLEQARARLGKVPIQLVPLGGGEAPTMVDGPARVQWQRFARRLPRCGIVVADLPSRREGA